LQAIDLGEWKKKGKKMLLAFEFSRRSKRSKTSKLSKRSWRSLARFVEIKFSKKSKLFLRHVDCFLCFLQVFTSIFLHFDLRVLLSKFC